MQNCCLEGRIFKQNEREHFPQRSLLSFFASWRIPTQIEAAPESLFINSRDRSPQLSDQTFWRSKRWRNDAEAFYLELADIRGNAESFDVAPQCRRVRSNLWCTQTF